MPRRRCILVLAAALSPLCLGADDDPAEADPSAPLFPHPVITEVLFNVPRSKDDPARADANADGQRHSTADEFVELFNPHPRTINLRGYTITNRLTTFDPDTKRGVRFTFPSFRMKPGDVVVVFNGHHARIPGPVGNDSRPPSRPNDRFDGAYVFSMKATARTHAFANTGDFALLSDPRGRPIDAVAWGEPDPAPPSETIRLVEVEKNPKGSVQRVTADADLIPHRDIDRAMFSPGVLPPDPDAAHADATDDDE